VMTSEVSSLRRWPEDRTNHIIMLRLGDLSGFPLGAKTEETPST
jgi:hypothetical protein